MLAIANTLPVFLLMNKSMALFPHMRVTTRAKRLMLSLLLYSGLKKMSYTVWGTMLLTVMLLLTWIHVLSQAQEAQMFSWNGMLPTSPIICLQVTGHCSLNRASVHSVSMSTSTNLKYPDHRLMLSSRKMTIRLLGAAHGKSWFTIHESSMS